MGRRDDYSLPAARRLGGSGTGVLKSRLRGLTEIEQCGDNAIPDNTQPRPRTAVRRRVHDLQRILEQGQKPGSFRAPKEPKR